MAKRNTIRKRVAKLVVNTIVLPAVIIAIRRRIFKLIDDKL